MARATAAPLSREHRQQTYLACIVVLVAACMVVFLPGRAWAAPASVAVAGRSADFCVAGNATVYADAMAISLPPDANCNVDIGSVAIVGPAGQLAGRCVLPGDALAGSDVNCGGVSVGGGWSPTLAAVTFTGLQPGLQYRVDIWEEVNWSFDLTPPVSTMASAVVLQRHDGAPQGQASLAVTSNLFETVTWTISQARLDAEGRPLQARTFSVRTTRGGVATWTSSNQIAGFAYRYSVAGQAAGQAFTSNTVDVLTPEVVSAKSGGLGWTGQVGRGYVVLSWPREFGATDYSVSAFDGAHWERVQDVGLSTVWDSRVARVYPTAAWLASHAGDCGSAFAAPGTGVSLQDDPQRSGNPSFPQTLYSIKAACSGFTPVSGYDLAVTASDSGQQTVGSVHVQLPIQTDTGQPDMAVTVAGGARATDTGQVTVAATAAESPSGVCAVAVSNDAVAPSLPSFDGIIKSLGGCAPGQVQAAPAQVNWSGSWSLTAGPGLKTVYAWAESTAGVWSHPASTTVYEAFSPNAPTVSLAIDGGSAATADPAVVLELTAAGGNGPTSDWAMRFSNDNQTWSSWQPFGAVMPWQLHQGSGIATVYAQVRDADGLVAQANAAIRLQAPVGLAGGGGDGSAAGPGLGGAASVLTTNTGISGLFAADSAQVSAYFVKTPLVAVTLTPPPGCDAVALGFDGVHWGPKTPESPGIAERFALTLPPGDGRKAVLAACFGRDGSMLGQYGIPFVLDTTPPTLAASWLGDAAVTAGGEATLLLAASDAISPASNLTVSLAVNGAPAVVQPYTSTIPLNLTKTGVNVVTVSVADQAGNVATAVLSIYN